MCVCVCWGFLCVVAVVMRGGDRLPVNPVELSGDGGSICQGAIE